MDHTSYNYIYPFFLLSYRSNSINKKLKWIRKNYLTTRNSKRKATKLLEIKKQKGNFNKYFKKEKSLDIEESN